ncbi:MAG: hypothetical protein LQ344_001846 [Seirophora lacunosa]|nr:MAG: hypothetical protein LQ344_001846 [Seirophora lacunosa]
MDITNSVWAGRPLWEKWEASDPNGHPLETETWKLWDPTQEEADDFVNLVRAGRVGSLRRTEAEEAFSTHGIPRYVRLSDSAVGVIVRLWLSRRTRKKWYSLDFTAAWTLLQHRTCLGHAWLTDGKPTRYLGATLWGNLNEEEVVRFRDSVSVDQWGNIDPQVNIAEVLPTKEKLPFLFNDRDYLRWRAEEEFLSRLAEQSHTLPIKQDGELLFRQESGEALPTEINDPFVTLDEDLRQLAEKPPALTTNQDSELPELGEALPNETKDRLPATEDEEYFRHLAQTLQALPTEPDSKPPSREKLSEALPPE